MAGLATYVLPTYGISNEIARSTSKVAGVKSRVTVGRFALRLRYLPYLP